MIDGKLRKQHEKMNVKMPALSADLPHRGRHRPQAANEGWYRQPEKKARANSYTPGRKPITFPIGEGGPPQRWMRAARRTDTEKTRANTYRQRLT